LVQRLGLRLGLRRLRLGLGLMLRLGLGLLQIGALGHGGLAAWGGAGCVPLQAATVGGAVGLLVGGGCSLIGGDLGCGGYYYPGEIGGWGAVVFRRCNWSRWASSFFWS
jgi:hypothetical protein